MVLASDSSPRPHILLILADDLGHNDIGYNSVDMPRSSPVLTALARDGVRLTRYYTQPSCTPARASLLSGKYPMSIGAQHECIQPGSMWGLSLGLTTLPELLRDHGGYSTAMVGKWDVGHFAEAMWPTRRGFDKYVGLISRGLSNYTSYDNGGFTDVHDGTDPLPEAVGTYATFLWEDTAVRFVRDHAATTSASGESGSARPLFLYVALNAIHDTLSVPAAYAASAEYASLLGNLTYAKRQLAAGALKLADNAVGTVVEELKTQGMWASTVLVFISDNGGSPTDGGNNWPLRGAKKEYFDGGVLVPGFVHSPLLPPSARGAQIASLVHVSDWMPTFAGLAAVSPEVLAALNLDGVDQWQLIVAGSSPIAPRRTQIIHNIDYVSEFSDAFVATAAQTVGAVTFSHDGSLHKLFVIEGDSGHVGETYAAFSNDATGTAVHNESFFLFDLDGDPLESTNVWNQSSAARDAGLVLLCAAWRESVSTNFVPQVWGAAKVEMVAAFEQEGNFIRAWKSDDYALAEAELKPFPKQAFVESLLPDYDADWCPFAELASTYDAGVVEQRPAEALANTRETIPALALSFTVANEYGDAATLRSRKHYSFLSEDVLILEPHRETLVEVETSGETADVASFKWSMKDTAKVTFEDAVSANDAALGSISGSRVSATCTSPGVTTAVIDAYDADDALIASTTRRVRCLYVKRELRTLSRSDREAFLDAMHAIWATPNTTLGRVKYPTSEEGYIFTGIDTYVRVHADMASGSVLCDKWHEGTGFLTHHLAMGISFESALRCVDPRVTMPYWDFTIDGQKIADLELGPRAFLQVNEWIFSEDWFGSPNTVTSAIPDGRWAYATATRASQGDTSNAYGFLRAPWNVNPSPFVSRHLFDICGLEPVNKPVPTCATHYALLNYSSLASYLTNVAGYGHGPMHVNTGGSFGGCVFAMDKLYETYADEMSEVWTLREAAAAALEQFGVDPAWTDDTEFTVQDVVVKHLHLEYFHIYRMLYRSQTCALDGRSNALQCACDDAGDCACACEGADDPETFDWQNLEPCMYPANNETATFLKAVIPESVRKAVTTLMCTASVYEGEALESASPSDPIFFMIHPAIDRLTTAKRLAGVSDVYFDSIRIQPFLDETWLDYSYYENCQGHGADDEVLAGLDGLDSILDFETYDLDGDGKLSNLEFYQATDPTKDTTGYIYDHIGWDHCNGTAVTAASLETSETDSEYLASYPNNVDTPLNSVTQHRQRHNDAQATLPVYPY